MRNGGEKERRREGEQERWRRGEGGDEIMGGVEEVKIFLS